MPSQGPNVPTAVNETGWLSENQALTDNDTGATFSLFGAGLTDTLDLSDFNFAIPALAEIIGIEVEIQHADSSPDKVSDAQVQLLKAGSPVGTDKGTDTFIGGTSFQTRNYGGAADLWGTTWTAAEINASGFGVRLVYEAIAGPTTASVDVAKITVTYSNVAEHIVSSLDISSGPPMPIEEPTPVAY